MAGTGAAAIAEITALVPPGVNGAALLVPLVIPLIASAPAGLIACCTQDDGWYTALRRPWFAPAVWVYRGPWYLLCLCIGFASWLVWAWGDHASAAYVSSAVFYAFCIFCSAVWPFVFFGCHSLGGGLIFALAFLGSSVATIVSFAHISHVAAGLMAPVAAWAAFLTVVCWSLLRHNHRGHPVRLM